MSTWFFTQAHHLRLGYPHYPQAHMAKVVLPLRKAIGPPGKRRFGMATRSEAVDRLLQEPINPRTGAVWRLTDREVAAKVDSYQASLSSPTKALAYLKENGFLTSTGRVPKKYGG